MTFVLKGRALVLWERVPAEAEFRSVTQQEAPSVSTGRHQTVAGYFRAFTALRWDELPTWPPDVFCLCNLILDHTEAYRFVVAPPPNGAWPPTPDWNERVVEAARRWRAACGDEASAPPELVRRCWETVLRSRKTALSAIRTGESWELCQALLTLHAVADEVCSGLAAADTPGTDGSFEARAWATLEEKGSLSHVSPLRVRIVPKSNFAARGMTIRSLSRYLALFYESVEVRWRRVEGLGPVDRAAYHVLLLPWPLAVRASDFHPVPNPLGNMDPDRFGFFEFAPWQHLDPAYVSSALRAARSRTGTVDAVVLPESAVQPDEVAMLERLLDEHGVPFLITGVRSPPTDRTFGRNYLHFGVRAESGWERYQQDKHHRWCLDENQIRQYHLAHSLDPGKRWWEAIDIPLRTLNIVDVGAGATTAPLVCEDLARMDEVTDLLRRIGPSVVVAVLLDGPQLVTRWPCRYASVLADEPGSAVLTLTSFGMTTRSRPPGLPPSRVVALWADGAHGTREIELGRGARAVLFTAAVESKTVWTADGRCHLDVPCLTLSATYQLRADGE